MAGTRKRRKRERPPWKGGPALKARREQLGWGQGKLCGEVYERTGVVINKQQVSQYETGTHEPGATIFLAICKAMDFDPWTITPKKE